MNLENLVVGSGTPSELNFALEGKANFAFEDNYGRAFSGSMVLRVGQGHSTTLSNNWWLGTPGCYEKSCIDCHKCDCSTGGLVCGGLFFQPKVSCYPLHCNGESLGESLSDRFVVMPESWMT